MTLCAGQAGRMSSRRIRALAFGAFVLVALTVELIWAAPYLGRAGRAVGNADLGYLALAVLAEIASMLSFARLQRVMLGAGGVRVPLRRAAATAVAGNAISVTLPGGSIASLAYTSKRMWSWGASAPLIGFTFAATAALSTTALALLGAVGGTLAQDTGHALWSVAEIAAALAVVGALIATLRRPDLVRALTGRVLRLARRDTSRAEIIAAELTAIRPGVVVWSRAFAFALLNWATDLACLLAAAHAVGVEPSLHSVVLAYVAAMAASSSIPLVPGGLGVVEAAAVLVLVNGGLAVAGATAAVLVYRLISLGAVALVGWLVVLAQRRRLVPAR
jgi:hypothetical protein